MALTTLAVPNPYFADAGVDSLQQDVIFASDLAQRLHRATTNDLESKSQSKESSGPDYAQGAVMIAKQSEQLYYVIQSKNVINANKVFDLLEEQIKKLPEKYDPSMCEEVKSWCLEFFQPDTWFGKNFCSASMTKKAEASLDEIRKKAEVNPKSALEHAKKQVLDGQREFLENTIAVHAGTALVQLIGSFWICADTIGHLSNIKADDKTLNDLSSELGEIGTRLEDTWTHTSAVVEGYTTRGEIPPDNVLHTLALRFQEIRNDLVSCILTLEKMESDVSSHANKHKREGFNSLAAATVSTVSAGLSTASVAFKGLASVYKVLTWVPTACNFVAGVSHGVTYGLCQKKLSEIRQELQRGKDIERKLQTNLEKYKQRLLEMRILMGEENTRAVRNR